MNPFGDAFPEHIRKSTEDAIRVLHEEQRIKVLIQDKHEELVQYLKKSIQKSLFSI